MTRHRPRGRSILLCLCSVLALSGPSPALGHAAYQGSDPEDGARLAEAPQQVRVSYAEPPVTDSSFVVTDGCGRDVTESVEILNREITAAVAEGEPGRWAVEWRVVSAVDGHLTRDGFQFSVSGRADCSRPGRDATQAAPSDEDEGDSGALIPVVMVGVLLVGLALTARVLTRNR